MTERIADGAGYGALPPTPADQWQPNRATGPAPAAVTTAMRLMMLRAVIGVIGVLVLFTTRGTLRRTVVADNPNLSPARIDHLVNGAIGVGVAIGVIFFVLYVLLALQVGKGKQWARVVTWVLAALGVLGAVAELARPATSSSRVITVVTGLIDLALIVLLASAASNAYFSQRRNRTA